MKFTMTLVFFRGGTGGKDLEPSGAFLLGGHRFLKQRYNTWKCLTMEVGRSSTVSIKTNYIRKKESIFGDDLRVFFLVIKSFFLTHLNRS